ncbi:bifunctional transaldolase/phosoglucose isomerase [Achromobacter aloeverae]|uniref:Transaldolase n=1 Tax=Achromobacter aloeverae TaxID=1750518 RepID=A0A4Q1HG38_9BURK|nr:bifunctional transaldolase/phosoglucose isomerase [Achromobacter aloeverae]RXN85104.1 transaldolase [Achromobacter aloeverae]
MSKDSNNKLRQLAEAGQAIWLDFLSRDFIANGGLAKLVAEDGLTGVTSNPSIFEKAIGHGNAYDGAMNDFLAKADADAGTVYEHLAVQDIQAAADVLRPVYDRLAGQDGYVSLEVSPYLAYDTDGTLAEARRLWRAVDRPNLMIKVPGTREGVPAIRQLIAEGINVNVTLLFSRDAYAQVANAYIEGLEQRIKAGGDVSRMASVASFFVSRIDTRIDKAISDRLAAGDAESAALKALQGKVAIANAKLAYQDYEQLITSQRWKTLAERGARPQRLLWASTGTKNPAYPATLYVDTLIGRDTVNTMPSATMDAFRHGGDVSASLTQDVTGAQHVLDEAQRLGLRLDQVTADLVDDGARQFSDAFDALLGSVANKRNAFLGDRLNGVAYHLPEALEEAAGKALERARAEGWSRRLWQGDATMWTGGPESKWVGWLAAGQGRQADPAAIADLARAVQADGYTHAVLLGMGGSSLGPEVLAQTLGVAGKGLKLHALDSTNPDEIGAVEQSIDISRTLFIVASKSGSTLEPEILNAYFHAATVKAVGAGDAGRHFVAVTDPGSKLEAAAKAAGYRAIFLGDPAIGGRYSVLSVFGLVPLGVLGHDVAAFMQATQPMVRACGPSAPPSANPGVRLGAILGAAATSGRDKLTVFASPSLASVGSWLEQLVAESTGKHGKGIVPVDLEPVGKPGDYGQDRIFAYLYREGDDRQLDAPIQALADAGHPVVRITLPRAEAIGQEFFRWEVATAVAGAVIGIDPFDQPDVEASKVKTRALTDAYEKTGELAPETALLTDGDLSLYGDAALRADGTLEGALGAHLARLRAGDYAAVLAYIARNATHEQAVTALRTLIRDQRRVATVGGFGPRFLHSTGQAYKGGPNSGVFLQITADPAHDLPIPDRKISFGTVQAAQAIGDLQVLAERGRRYLRVHIAGGRVEAGLARLVEAATRALRPR